MAKKKATRTNATNAAGTNAAPANRPPQSGQPNTAGDPQPSSTTGTPDLDKPQKRRFDVDLVLANFQDEFDIDTLQAADRLHDLLIDLVACEARCSLLDAARKTSAEPKMEPAGSLSEPKEYLRELTWLANNQLDEAIESGKASTAFLCQLSSHPDLLRLASRAAVDGDEAIADLVKEHQVETWNWLRDEVLNGNLQKHLGDKVVGRHVAVWKKDQPYAEMVIGDSPDEVRAAARERWMVPNELVAETFVDAD